MNSMTMATAAAALALALPAGAQEGGFFDGRGNPKFSMGVDAGGGKSKEGAALGDFGIMFGRRVKDTKAGAVYVEGGLGYLWALGSGGRDVIASETLSEETRPDGVHTVWRNTFRDNQRLLAAHFGGARYESPRLGRVSVGAGARLGFATGSVERGVERVTERLQPGWVTGTCEGTGRDANGNEIRVEISCQQWGRTRTTIGQETLQAGSSFKALSTELSVGATVRLTDGFAARAEASKLVGPGLPSQNWSYRAAFRWGYKD